MVARLGALLACLALVNADLITNLPGAPNVNFKQYAGYFKVSNTHFLHYWFLESQNSPSTDPVLLWLTGGPGCSGFSAILTEWGPFLVNKDGTLRLNQWSWNKKANILVIESPAGVGYSYTTDGDAYTNDDRVAVENRNALKEFFTTFPNFMANDLYITGESYGGIYVPMLVKLIIDNQADFHMNLKGMMIGNGCVSNNENVDSLIQFTYNHGMVGESTWNRLKSDCCSGAIDGCPFHSFTGFSYCATYASDAVQNVWHTGINPYNMYQDCASASESATKPKTRYSHDFFMMTGKRLPDSRDIVCMNEDAVTEYLNKADVRAALFVPSSLPRWDICNEEVVWSYQRQYSEMQSRVQEAVKAGMRVLFYHGDVDLACNYLLGQRFSQKLGYTLTSAKKSFTVNGQVGGFHTQYGKVEFETIRGAGHLVPTDKPEVAYHILESFLSERQP